MGGKIKAVAASGVKIPNWLNGPGGISTIYNGSASPKENHIHIFRLKAVGQILADYSCTIEGCKETEKRVIGVPA